jgi:hypothetical protein
MSPEQFRNALKIRTFDSSPSRMVSTYGAAQGQGQSAAANESPSRSVLLGSSSAPLTSRMQAVSPNHLFEVSTARRGAWVDEGAAHSDRATAVGRSSSQPRVQFGAPVEGQEQFDLDLRVRERERDPLSYSGLGLGQGPTRGPVGVQRERGAWTHRPQEVKRSPSASLYFRSQVANFGMTAVGTNARQKLELCNSSGEEVRGSQR